MADKPTYEELEQRVKELERAEEERSQVEKAMQDSEQFKEHILQSLVCGLYIYNFRKARNDFITPQYTAITGWTLRELNEMGPGFNDLFHPEDRARIEEHFHRIMTSGDSDILEIEYRFRTKQGCWLWCVSRDTVFERDERGDVVRFIGSFFDITERKQAEEALRESEEKYRALFENANDAIFVAQDGMTKFPNPSTETLLGYTQWELTQISADFIHPEDRGMVVERHTKRLRGEEPPSTYSFRVIRKTGEELWVQVNTVLISWEGRPATLNFLRDITRQKRLEARFQQAQRMESIGTLAGGIAHDFNNLLMSIQGNASLMLLQKETGDPEYESLRNIEECVREGADLTKQLLGFARGGRYEIRPTDLNDLIKTQNRIFGQAKKEIRIHGRYEKDLRPVESDQSQIQQVLMNLYLNAAQAMPGGGELYTETKNVDLDGGYEEPPGVAPGKYVRVSVTDTGTGMDEKTKERIFEPFFTTQEMGRGTGLGLASVYGIVKNHGGFINVSSEKGKGSTFTFYLPAAEPQAEGLQSETKAELSRGEETILLVDDEDRVLGVGEKLLKRLGYRVLCARSGEEALEIYEKGREDIDLVLMDMIMPGMDGGETYDRLKEINPDIKVLLLSGYSINGRAKEILERGCNGFIQKPFNIKDLSQKIRQTLGPFDPSS